ncbi:MAG: AI-2E family transporter [Methylococcaceae bacterium TMED69]|nr:MAG: AI-2E family transporter [Methylococcaceae bacterium TMED69]|tara:strand:+ start:1884 stop:2942 length:1059 start_codon:yes stop_codon:yes gene_type:complete
MFNSLRKWFDDHFSHPDAIVIVILIVAATTIIFFFGEMLAPVIAASIIAYMLEGFVQFLIKENIPRIIAVYISFFVLIGLMMFFFLGLAPVVSNQIGNFLGDLPKFVVKAGVLLENLPDKLPLGELYATDGIVSGIVGELTTLGQTLLSFSISSIPTMVLALIYLFLVPLLVFFFLKDKDLLISFIKDFVPKDRLLLGRVWKDVDRQIGNYMRGKFYEIVIVGTITYFVFWLMGLNYSALLGVIVGLSVIIPFVGAAIVTVPVIIAAFLQFGFGTDLAWIIGIYFIIQILDGNVLVPILFSEAVNLHPVAIVVAVLIFGGIWGFWGVFFAIPLATVIKSILIAWPSYPQSEC